MDPPTAFLPPLKNIRTCSYEQLSNVLTSLRQIFIPEVRGSIRRRGGTAADTAENSQRAAIESIRSDPFERSYTIQWLTRFISSYTQEPDSSQDSSITDRAAAILAICAGAAASGVLTRNFTFPTNIGTSSESGSLTTESSALVRDVPLESFDTTSVGAQTWGGACILSELIAESPEAFGISPGLLATRTPLRILEVGAGTGLTSITYGKMLQHMKSSLQVSDLEGNGPAGLEASRIDISVVATDFHPSVFSNLCFNLAENFPEQCQTINTDPRVDISNHFPLMRACLLDWAKFHEAKFHQVEEKHWVYTMSFDVVLGADIIYEDLHAAWIKSCLRRLLKKPSYRLWDQKSVIDDFQNPLRNLKDILYPLFHLMVPLRGTHVKELQKVEVVFPYGKDVLVHRQASKIGAESTPWDLAILSQEDITCDAYTDEEREDVVYRYYRIGWM